MIDEILHLSEAEAAAVVRERFPSEGRTLILYKFKDLERIQRWRTRHDLGAISEVFVVPDDDWTEMKNVYVITGHEGPVVIFFTGPTDRGSFTGFLWRELQNLGSAVPVWVVA